MPKTVTKSVSRCSSRSSRSSCRKRRSPRDNLLSSIREALRSSPSCTKRSNILKRESPKLQRPLPLIPKIIEKASPEVKISEPKTGEKAIRGLIEHGIRYIMLPLHLFNFCVWGSPNQSSTEPEVSSKKIEEKKNSKKRNPSPASSTSGFSSCSSNFSKNCRIATIESKESSEVPEKSKASSASITSGGPREKSTTEIPPAVEKPRKNTHGDSDDSTDEMVTADEYFDDSSNERWSSAESSTSMNMSIDIEGYNNGLERFSSRIENDDSSMEEPMDVSMEESSFNVKQSVQNRSPIGNRFRSNNLKKIAEKKSTDRVSSSSCTEERDSSYHQDFSSSSADREIGRIFARTSISLSSDDESSSTNGRRNNPFVNLETMKKRTSSTENNNEPRNVRSKRSNDREILRSPKRSPNSIRNNRYAKRIDRDFPKVSNQTDSAYSDEDVEMNSINESYIQNLHHQSFAMPNHRVIEWMEQDLDYVADAEDSNDALPILEKPTISLMKQDSSQLNKTPEKSKKNRGTSRRIFAAEESNDDIKSVTGTRGPPGFPDIPQHPSCTNCHCGNPKCFFLPVSADFSTNESTNKNYPRAPSPLRHLYYEYPEFMSPPKETIVDKKSPYVLVPANLVLP